MRGIQSKKGQWAANEREEFLQELVRLEGRGDYIQQKRCAQCEVAGVPAVHCCRDCFTDALFCKQCTIVLHRDTPLHQIETWNDEFFVPNTLKDLGLRVQLGHGRRGECPGTVAKIAEEAKRTPEEVEKAKKAEGFCIVDTNGIHEVTLDFCTCGRAQAHDVQLLRARLFPATTTRPPSAATFRVLRKFHLMSFETKCSTYEFYNALARESNNTGNFSHGLETNVYVKILFTSKSNRKFHFRGT
ncbi:hypothetical protein B0H13DRAFT_2228508 [Mycena leptocephala]|nr:hypothetical protein B0H13DRAFT_2228508 [Mycena leptocephala]